MLYKLENCLYLINVLYFCKHLTWDRYTLTNKYKAIVRLISWGASIQSIKVPNRDGKLADVVLGFDNIDGKVFVWTSIVFQKQVKLN